MTPQRYRWLFVVVIAVVGMCFLVELAIYVHPPLAVAGLAAFQAATDGLRGMDGAGADENPRRLLTVTAAYHGARQRLAWNAARDRFRAEGRMLTQDRDLEQWQTPYGNWYVPLNNWHSLPSILGQMQAGYYAVEGTSVCKQGDIVLDCGAHIGTYTRKAVDDGAKLVVAIEPSPKNLRALRKNLAAEIEAGSVIVAPVGVWDREEVLPMYQHDDHTAADSFTQKGGTRSASLPLTTIDKLVNELGLKRIDVIKMDIKGATAKAIRGGVSIIERDRPMLALAVEEGDDVDNLEEICTTVWSIHSSYESKCGDCSLVGGWPRPNVIFFR